MDSTFMFHVQGFQEAYLGLSLCNKAQTFDRQARMVRRGIKCTPPLREWPGNILCTTLQRLQSSKRVLVSAAWRVIRKSVVCVESDTTIIKCSKFHLLKALRNPKARRNIYINNNTPLKIHPIAKYRAMRKICRCRGKQTITGTIHSLSLGWELTASYSKKLCLLRSSAALALSC